MPNTRAVNDSDDNVRRAEVPNLRADSNPSSSRLFPAFRPPRDQQNAVYSRETRKTTPKGDAKTGKAVPNYYGHAFGCLTVVRIEYSKALLTMGWGKRICDHEGET